MTEPRYKVRSPFPQISKLGKGTNPQTIIFDLCLDEQLAELRDEFAAEVRHIDSERFPHTGTQMYASIRYSMQNWNGEHIL